MLLLLFYLPFLAFSPILLVAAVLFCIPGGFIIVLGGAYFLAMELVGLVGVAAGRRWRTAHTNRMRKRHGGGLAQPAIDRRSAKQIGDREAIGRGAGA